MKEFKYLDLSKELLAEARKKGEGARFPSEREICYLHDVSRTTAKMALNHLNKSGLVTRQVGRGTFLTSGSTHRIINFIYVEAIPGKEVIDFIKNEAEAFASKRSGLEIRFVPVTGAMIQELNSIPGTKILYWPYGSYLSGLNIFQKLNDMPGFTDLVAKINGISLKWEKSFTGEMQCLSVPLCFDVDAFAFNQKFAKELGLPESGPQNWHEVILWAKRASKTENILSTAIPDLSTMRLPFSYLYDACGGKDIIAKNGSNLSLNLDGISKWLEFFSALFSIKNCIRLEKYAKDPILYGKTLFSYLAGTWIFSQKRKLRSPVKISLCEIPSCNTNFRAKSIIRRYELSIVRGEKSSDIEIHNAWDFIRHMIADESAQKRLIKSFSTIASNREIFEEQKNDPEWRFVVDCFSRGILETDHPVRFGINTVLRKCFIALVTGKMSAEETSDKIIEYCNMLLEVVKERTFNY